MQYQAPQSEAEVLPIELDLRRLDDRLRITWNPKALVVKGGKIDAVGHSAAPVYAGRWQVVRLPGEGDLMPAIIYTVREDVTEAYKPIGEWLVQFFRKWDAAQSTFAETMRREWQEHDEAQERHKQISNETEARGFLEGQWLKLGGEKRFIGRGFSVSS